MTELIARCQDFVAFGQATHRGSRSGFGIAKLEGYSDGVDMEREQVKRPGTHGYFDLPGELSSRDFAMRGLCWADSPTEARGFQEQLSGLLADGSTDEWTITELGLTTTTVAGRAARPTFGKTYLSGGRIVANWQLQLFAPDPWRFGATRSFGPALTVPGVMHAGNFAAAPVITVSATTSMSQGFGIWGDGSSFVVHTPVTPGNPVVVDFRDGSVYRAGVRLYDVVADGRLLTVPHGKTSTWYLAPNVGVGSGTISVSVTDTYV